jgi:alginate O-acetyltransferase complex protein AlgI
MLTGFWHGANWNFIIWGLYFAVFLVLEKFAQPILKKLGGFNHILVTFIILISFIIFNAVDLSQAVTDIGGLFGAGGIPFASTETLYHLANYSILLVLAIVGSTPVVKTLAKKFSASERFGKIANILEPVMLVALLAIVTAFLVDSSSNPFLYFRF